MEPEPMPLIRTRSGNLRPTFESPQDWSGTVHVAGDIEDPRGSLAVGVVTDASFRGPPLDVRIEQSADGLCWSEAPHRPRRLDVVRGEMLAPPPIRPGRRRARRARRNRG